MSENAQFGVIICIIATLFWLDWRIAGSVLLVFIILIALMLAWHALENRFPYSCASIKVVFAYLFAAAFFLVLAVGVLGMLSDRSGCSSNAARFGMCD